MSLIPLRPSNGWHPCLSTYNTHHAMHPYICNCDDAVLIIVVSQCWPIFWYPSLHIPDVQCRYCYPRSIAMSNLSNLTGTSKISCSLLSNLCGWYLRIVLHTEIVTFSDMRNSVDRCEYKLAIFMTLCWLYGDGDPRCGIPPPLPPLPSLSVLLCLSAATRRMIGGQ